jgi:hypothetical protein
MDNHQFVQLDARIAVLESVVIAVIGAIGEAGVDRSEVSRRLRHVAAEPTNADMKDQIIRFAERVDRVPRIPPKPATEVPRR